MATGVRSKAPAVQIASVGEASRSSSQRAIPIPTPGNISQEIVEFFSHLHDGPDFGESARDVDACSVGSPADHVIGASGQIESFELGHALSGIGNFRVP